MGCAICINQADISERNAQVQLMLNIYRSAACVLAYIGAETETDQLAFATLTELYEFISTDATRDELSSTTINEAHNMI
jgi:hypothetical protein